MKKNPFAASLRRSAEVLLATAGKMIAAADEIDPPPPVDHSVRSVCGTCGTEYRGREYATGQRCESCDERGETGYLKRVKPAEPVEDWDAYVRTYADEPLVTKGGGPLGVTRDALAFQAAWSDFLDDDPDNAALAGMASTYRGRRA